jgi:hypothetical protein
MTINPTGAPPKLRYEDLVSGLNSFPYSSSSRDADSAAEGLSTGKPFFLGGIQYVGESGGDDLSDIGVSNVSILDVNHYGSRSEAETSIVPFGVDNISVFHDGVILSYVRDAIGTALTTGGGDKWSPADDVAMFQHWGAVAFSVEDQRLAVQNALRSGYEIRNRKYDAFTCKSTISIQDDLDITVDGGIIIFDFASLSGGIVARRGSVPDGTRINRTFKNMGFLTKNSNCRYAIQIEHSPNLDAGDLGTDRYYRHLVMEHCDFGPFDYDDTTMYFMNSCLDLEDVHAPYLRNCTFSGPKVSGGQPLDGTVGINIRGASDPVRNDMVDCHWRSLDFGVVVGDDIEGIKIEGGSFVDVINGFYFDPDTTGYENLAFYISSVEFNCVERGVYINAGAEIFINGSTFRQRGDYGDWVGIELSETLGVRDFKIWSNSFSGTAGSINNRNAVLIGENSNRGRIFDNFGVNLNEFCDVSNLTTDKEIIVKDNNWVDDLSVNRRTSSDQASSIDNVYVFSAFDNLNFGLRTVSELQSLTGLAEGSTAFCTDESGGKVPVFYDNVNWRRVTDRAVIS